MEPLASQVDPTGPDFVARRDEMMPIVETLRAELDKVRNDRNPKALAYLEKMGKMPVWRRLELRAHRSWSCPPWPPTACTRVRPRARAR